MSVQSLLKTLKANLNQQSPSQGVVDDVIGDKVFIATRVGLVKKLKGSENIRIKNQVRIDGEYCYLLSDAESEIHFV